VGRHVAPRAFLIETVAGELIYLASWTALPSPDAVGRDCAAHRTTQSKTLLLCETSGPVVPVEQQSVRDLLFDFEASECEWVRIEDLPVAVQQAIRSSPPDDAQGEDGLLPVP
jgi:hypothetical protein